MGCGASCTREPWKNFRGHPLLQEYKVHRRLGFGAFSEVWKATHIESKEVRALKVVFWGNPDIKEHHRRILKKEVVMLREMQHEHIVRLLHDSDDGKNLIMALEYLKGGGLLEHLVEVEHYTEERAASLFTQMLQAVCYMHSKHIMHRDIKPENVVFVDPVHSLKRNTRLTIKLVDFGLARPYSSARSVKARLGSPGFMAPETINYERHTPAMDIYSLGVLLFVMLTGHKPMKSEEARNLTYHKYEAYDYPKMSSWTWKRLSKSAQSLVLALMERNPLKRLSADEALKHEWVVTCGGTKPVNLPSVGKAAAGLGRERRLKGLAQAVIAAKRLSKLSMRQSTADSNEGFSRTSTKTWKSDRSPAISANLATLESEGITARSRGRSTASVQPTDARKPASGEDVSAAIGNLLDVSTPLAEATHEDNASPQQSHNAVHGHSAAGATPAKSVAWAEKGLGKAERAQCGPLSAAGEKSESGPLTDISRE